MSKVILHTDLRIYADIISQCVPSYPNTPIALCVKDNGAADGNPAIALTFPTVDQRHVCHLMTLKSLLLALSPLVDKYPHLLDRKWPSHDSPVAMHGEYEGYDWKARLMYAMYVVVSDQQHVGICEHEEQVEPLIQSLIDEDIKSKCEIDMDATSEEYITCSSCKVRLRPIGELDECPQCQHKFKKD